MKSLVVFYSRKGKTKKVGELISEQLNSDVEEIIDTKNRKGILGFIRAGKDANLKNLTVIEKTKKKPESYDVIILGTPIWSRNMTPAIRTYTSENKDKFKKIAFYCTETRKGGPNAFEDMSKLCEKEPKLTLEIIRKDIKKGTYIEKVNEFVQKIK